MRSHKKRSENTITGAKPRRRNDYIRLADGIFTSAVFIMIFALFCSARVGYFLLIALLVTPGVSILWAFLSSKTIMVSMDDGKSEMVLEKKDTDYIGYSVSNKLFFPSALIRINLECTGNLSMQDPVRPAAVMPGRSTKTGAVVCANHAGGAYAGIKDVYVEDFFGIVRFPVKNIIGSTTKTYGIMPGIPEVSSRDPLLEEAMKVAYGEDNSEESADVPTYNFAGFPGYDYREYVPGDPLKRINSKLSAKKDSLMVRLDEKPIVAGVVFLLDSEEPQNAEENPLIPAAVENLAETSLGMAKTLLSREFGVTFFWKRNGSWEMAKIREERELEQMAGGLAFFTLEPAGKSASRIPDELSGSGCSIICFTCKADAELFSLLSTSASADPESVRIYNALTGEGRGL